MITDAVINDARRNEAGRHLYKYIYLSLYCKGSKGLFEVRMWDGAGDRTQTSYFDPTVMTVTLCLSCSLDAQPEVLGSTAGCWLSLLNLISIFSGLQLIRASSPIGLVWLSLPHLVSNSLEVCWQLFWHPTQLNYIIIQCPHDRLLDLWNRMFNRHQAEITVMQFTGYSFPAHHCSGTMGPSPCPIS